jgi:hypothetical protein
VSVDEDIFFIKGRAYILSDSFLGAEFCDKQKYFEKLSMVMSTDGALPGRLPVLLLINPLGMVCSIVSGAGIDM